jgi:large subunit ribosomal protein L25
MARKDLAVEPRQVLGKKVAQLRRTGVTPANVYGHGLDSVSVQIDTEVMDKTLKALLANEVIDLKISGERASRPVVVQKVQRHPLTSKVLHAEFYQVSLRQRMRADVPLIIVGTSEGVETYNGVLVKAIETVQVEALPLDLPSHIDVDITPLANLEDTLHVSDISVPEGVTLLTDPEVVIVKVQTPRISLELEEEAAAAAEEAEEAAEGEGEAAAGEEGESESEAEKEGETA